MIYKIRTLIITFSLLVSFSTLATDLINSEWLNQNINQTIIIDLRHPDIFEGGHIPNAINIPYSQFSRSKGAIKGFIAKPSVFQQLMQHYGIKNSDQVVLYSDWSFLESMRAYWVFDFYGHDSIKVLDGGYQSWEKSLFNTSFEHNKLTESQYIVEINADIISTKFKTFMATKNDQYIIIDARNPSHYKGQLSTTSRNGHIPNSINIPWVDLINNGDVNDKNKRPIEPSTLQDLSNIKATFSAIEPNKKILIYCNGGKESTVIYFALKSIGINAAVYDGSWFEWSSDLNMPVEQDL